MYNRELETSAEAKKTHDGNHGGDILQALAVIAGVRVESV